MADVPTPSKREWSVKLHELRRLGSGNLTLICELNAGALFSSCFWNGTRLRVQERERFISEMWGRDAEK